jgi:hypothetical protein
MPRRLFIAGLALLVVAGCAALDPRHVVLSESEIASLVARQFPQQRRVLEVVDVTMASPRLRLLPDRNRIGTELDLSAAERITGRSVRGSLALDYALRFEPTDTSVRLAQVRVDRVNLESGGLVLPASTQRIGGLVAEHLLEDLVIWRAKPEQAEMMRRLGITQGAVNVTTRGIEINLGPR